MAEPASPLSYSALRGSEQLHRHESHSGISFIAPPVSMTLTAVAAILPVSILSLWLFAGVEAIARGRDARDIGVGLAVFAVAAVSLAVVVWLIVSLVRRRKTPICIGVIDRSLIVITPQQIIARKQFWAEDKPRLQLQKLISSFQSRGTLRVRTGRFKRVIVLENIPLSELTPAIAELTERIKTLSPRSAASMPAGDRSPLSAGRPTT